MGGSTAWPVFALGAVTGSSCMWALPKLLKLCSGKCQARSASVPDQPCFVQMPHPDWTPGKKQPVPYGVLRLLQISVFLHVLALPPHPPQNASVTTMTAGDQKGYIAYDPAAHDRASTYALVISTIVPRPIALVSSMNKVCRRKFLNKWCPTCTCTNEQHNLNEASAIVVCEQNLTPWMAV